MKKLLFLLIPFFMISCEKDLVEVEALGENASIIGTWVEEIDYQLTLAEDGITRLNRSEELSDFGYGFTFNEDGTFIEHKNSGWCGTPPISYDNFEGTWEPLSDSLLDITVAYWGGTMTYQMQIVSLHEDKLGIKYLFSEDRLEVK
ncbi:MAG: hypothetical protein GY790_14995 [Bacteroidetes bacterium]|nr:hypothetical protein [Bacteroidota bacterium]